MTNEAHALYTQFASPRWRTPTRSMERTDRGVYTRAATG